MEVLSGAIRGGTAGCSPVCLEQNRKTSARARCRSGNLLPSSPSRMRDLAMLGVSPRDHAARAHRHQGFADLSHAAFYGEEEGTTFSRKASDNHQQITLEYADEEDLRRQLGILRFKLKRKGSKPSTKHLADSSSSSSSSDSSDSEAEAERRSLRKQRSKSGRDVSVSELPVSEERKLAAAADAAPRPVTARPLPSGKEEGRQRPKAARDVSVHALPVLVEDRKISAPVSALPSLDHNRLESSLRSYGRVEARVFEPVELQSSTAQLQRLYNLPVREVAAALPDTVAKPKARVEVCMGGKCKKMGAEQLLCAFRNNLSGGASVEAVSCKCLKRCQQGVNVRFSQEGGEECDVQGQVDIEDVHELLRQHFPQFSETSRKTMLPGNI